MASISESTLHVPAAYRLNSRVRALTVSISTLTVIAAIVLVGHFLLADAATASDFTAKNLPPSSSHLFGTDWMGRDMLARTVAALSTSILIGLLAALTSALIALALGTAAALSAPRAGAALSAHHADTQHAPHADAAQRAQHAAAAQRAPHVHRLPRPLRLRRLPRLDTAITWLIDLLLGIPHIILLILISYALGKGYWGVTLAVALTHWPNLARIIRAEVLQCQQSPYVAQARKLGASPLSIARHHLIPHVLPQFLVGLVLLFPHAILHEAAITFLGFGLPPELPAIGIILSESMGYLSAGSWWLAALPGLTLMLIALLFNTAASNLRRLVDPFTSQE